MQTVLKKLELFILIGMLIFCATYISKITMDYTITSRNLVWCLGTIVLFLLIMARAMNGQVDFSILRRMIFPVFGGFLIVSIFSLTKAANLSEGWYEVLRIVLMIITLFVAVVIITENNPNILYKFIVLIELGLCAYGIYQYASQVDGKFVDHFGPATRMGTMANMNLCSSAHVLLMPFSVYAIWRYSKIWKILGIVAVASALFIVLFSLRTRSAWVALFITGIVATLHKRKIAVFMVLVFIVLGAAVYLTKGRAVFNTDSMRQRGDMWGGSLKMFKDHPLGVGAGNWRVNIPYYSRWMTEKTRAVAFKTIYFQRPHNDWLWVLAEQGAIGFILYISIFVIGLYYAIKARSVLMYSCLTAYMSVACFSFLKERTFHTVYLLLILASCVSLYHKTQPVKINKRAAYLCSNLVLACLLFVLFVFGVRYNTEKNVFKALHARKAKDWNAMLEHTKDISKFSTLDSYATPLLYYQGIGHFLKKDYPSALKKFEGALKENPNHIFVMMNLASCLSIHKRLPEAKKYYERVIELYPEYIGAQNNLAALNAVAMKGTKK